MVKTCCFWRRLMRSCCRMTIALTGSMTLIGSTILISFSVIIFHLKDVWALGLIYMEVTQYPKSLTVMNLLNCLHNVTFLNSGMLWYLVPCCQPWPLGCTNQFAKSSPQKEEHRWAASWACDRLCQERGVLRHQPQGEGCLPGPWPTRAGHTGGGECRHLGRQTPNLFGCIFFYFFSIYLICCSHISLILSVKAVEKLCWNTWNLLRNLFRLFLKTSWHQVTGRRTWTVQCSCSLAHR